MNEPAIDLGIVLALISSYKDKPIDEKTICFGEVGLSGEHSRGKYGRTAGAGGKKTWL